jgi:hypothetical protein
MILALTAVALVAADTVKYVEASSRITISLEPSFATIGDDVQITCAHNISEYSRNLPRIKVDGHPHSRHSAKH